MRIQAFAETADEDGWMVRRFETASNIGLLERQCYEAMAGQKNIEHSRRSVKVVRQGSR